MKLKFFEIAKQLSFKSNHPKARIGAVIVFKNRIIGLGFNSQKTHPKSSAFGNTLHAEMSAVINTRLDNLKGHEIYVYREDKTGKLAQSKPCEHCSKLLDNVGIDKVYYSDINGFNER